MVPAYGLDIETDTACGGLDPSSSRVLAVAVVGARRPLRRRPAVVLTGPEPSVLARLDRVLSRLPAGVLVTWNGSGFDLPFLADRARLCGVPLGLRLRVDEAIVRSHDPLPGHAGFYRASWYGHRHLDAYLAYRSLEGPGGRSCALKSVARRAGLPVVDVDASRVHELGRLRLRRYVASDARLAVDLARARWDTASSFVDQR